MRDGNIAALASLSPKCLYFGDNLWNDFICDVIVEDKTQFLCDFLELTSGKFLEKRNESQLIFPITLTEFCLEQRLNTVHEKLQRLVAFSAGVLMELCLQLCCDAANTCFGKTLRKKGFYLAAHYFQLVPRFGFWTGTCTDRLFQTHSLFCNYLSDVIRKDCHLLRG